jgi:hypothetical protein
MKSSNPRQHRTSNAFVNQWCILVGKKFCVSRTQTHHETHKCAMTAENKLAYAPKPILFLNFLRTFILLRIGASKSSTHWQRPPVGPVAPSTPIKGPNRSYDTVLLAGVYSSRNHSSQTQYCSRERTEEKHVHSAAGCFQDWIALKRPVQRTAAEPRVANQSAHASMSLATPPARQMANETAAVLNSPYEIIFLFT